MNLIALCILLLLIYFFTKRKLEISKISNFLYHYEKTSNLLIILSIIGFFFHLDYTEQWGDIIFNEKIFSLKNILFSSIAIFLIFLARFPKNNITKGIIHVSELLFWIYCLIVYKHGYAIGFAPLAGLSAHFHLLTLFLRLVLIRNLFFNLRNITISLFAFFIIFLKIYLFAFPYSFYWELKEEEKQINNTIETLQGDCNVS